MVGWLKELKWFEEFEKKLRRERLFRCSEQTLSAVFILIGLKNEQRVEKWLEGLKGLKRFEGCHREVRKFRRNGRYCSHGFQSVEEEC